MTFAISAAHNDARLEATRAFLDAGPGLAKIQLFSTERPIMPGGDPGGAPLVELFLAKPCGTVADGALALVPGDDGIITATGTPLWGRVFNGAGEFAIDGDVTDMSGTGDFKIPTATLYAGGTTRLVAGVLR